MDIISQLFPLPPIPTLPQAVFIGIALLTVIGALIVAIAPNLYHNALGLIVAWTVAPTGCFPVSRSVTRV